MSVCFDASVQGFEDNINKPSNDRKEKKKQFLGKRKGKKKNSMDISNDKLTKFHTKIPDMAKKGKRLEINWIFLTAAQNNANRTNYIKNEIDNMLLKSKCRLWGDRNEKLITSANIVN